jgi:hypothetical protein
MRPTPSQERLIAKLGLKGTLLEQFVLAPEAFTEPERYVESPSLMRFAMDVRRAIADEGWRPSLVRRGSK